MSGKALPSNAHCHGTSQGLQDSSEPTGSEAHWGADQSKAPCAGAESMKSEAGVGISNVSAQEPAVILSCRMLGPLGAAGAIPEELLGMCLCKL